MHVAGRSCRHSSKSNAPLLVRCSPSSFRVARRPMVVKATTASGGDRVVCVGEALFDFLANDKGVPREQVKSWTPYPGGAPCNVATAMSKLGIKTAFVSAIGDDDRGDEIMKLLSETQVDTSTVQRVPAPTRDIYVERTLDGDRVFAGFGRPSHEYCDCFLDPEKLPIETLKDADIMVTGTLGLASPQTREALWKAADLVKSRGGKLMVDVNWRPVFWEDLGKAKKEILAFLDKADIVKISDADLEFLYDMQYVTALLNPCAVAAHLPNAPAVLVTAGEEGAAYCCRSTKGEHTGFVPVFKLNVVDTTGAGDAFTAGFLYKLLEAGSLDRLLSNPKAIKEAVVFAAATGALTCTKPGAIAAQPHLDEVEKLFEESKSWYNFWGSETQEKTR